MEEVAVAGDDDLLVGGGGGEGFGEGGVGGGECGEVVDEWLVVDVWEGDLAVVGGVEDVGCEGEVDRVCGAVRLRISDCGGRGVEGHGLERRTL